MTTADIAALRNAVATASEAERPRALADLGLALRFSGATGPDGYDVIGVLSEAFEGLDPDDERWLPTVARLGGLHTLRYLSTYDEVDARQARSYCTLVVDSPKSSEANRAQAHLMLGQMGLLDLFSPEQLRLFEDFRTNLAAGGVLTVDFLTRSIELMTQMPDQVRLVKAIGHLTEAMKSDGLDEQMRQNVQFQLTTATLIQGDQPIGNALGIFRQLGANLPMTAPMRHEIDALASMCGFQAATQDEDPQSWATAAQDSRTVADSLPAEHPMRPILLDNAGVLLGRLADWAGDLSGLAVSSTLFAEAFGTAAPEHPLRATMREHDLSTALARASLDPDRDAVRRLGQRITQTPAVPGTDPKREAFLVGSAALLDAIGTGNLDGYAAAVESLRAAAANMEPDDRAVTHGSVAAALGDRYRTHGSRRDFQAAEEFFAAALLAAQEANDPDLVAGLHGARGTVRTVAAVHTMDSDLVDKALTDLDAALGGGRSGLLRARFEQTRALALMFAGLLPFDPDQILRAGELARSMDAHGSPVPTIALIPEGLLAGDLDKIDQGLAVIRQLADEPGFDPVRQGRTLGLLGKSLLIRYSLSSDSADLDRAIEAQEAARRHTRFGAGLPNAAMLLRDLYTAYRLRDADGDRAAAVQAGLAAVTEYVAAVFLQSGTDDAFAAARDVGQFVQHLALEWLRENRPEPALTVLELGRGLVVYTATATSGVADLLRDAGRSDLARLWTQGDGSTGPMTAGLTTAGLTTAGLTTAGLTTAGLMTQDTVSGLRGRVLDALANSDAGRGLLSGPAPSAIASTLERLGRTALAYLIPGVDGADGWALLVTADQKPPRGMRLPGLATGPDSDGVIDRYVAALDARQSEAPTHDEPDPWLSALDEVCRWAGRVVLEPLLAEFGCVDLGDLDGPSITLVPCGVLGVVPWHAAVVGGPDTPQRACEHATIGYAATARQLIEAGSRAPARLAERPVLVGDPNSDLFDAGAEVRALRACFYPDAIWYGPLGSAGEGTPDEVLRHLPGADPAMVASLVHIGCHAVSLVEPLASHLELAPKGPPGQLRVDRILRQAHGRSPGEPGPLLVLATCRSALPTTTHDEALTPATAFMAASATSVIASLWDVPSRLTAPFMFVLHDRLNADDPPTLALRAAQQWMLDPNRTPLPGMPNWLAERAISPALMHPAAWAAFTCQGR